MPDEKLRRRFSPYDPDYLEWRELAGRAGAAGRSPAEQAKWEQAEADRLAAQARKQVVSDIDAQRRRLHGQARTYRTDQFGAEHPDPAA